MRDDPSPDAQLLRDARAKAEKLLAGLVAQSHDLDRFARQLAPDKLARGHQAFAEAIDSARRTLDNIDQALAATAPSPSTPHAR
jgi:ABC-type transporter Mla subunit MlaD